MQILVILQDKVLLYIDEQVCSRLTGAAKKDCKDIVETKAHDLINSIKHGTVRDRVLDGDWFMRQFNSILEINVTLHPFSCLYQ